MKKTYHKVEIQIYPTRIQKKLFNMTIARVNELWNLALTDSLNSYKSAHTFQHHSYTAYIKEHPHLREVSSQALNQTIRDLDNALFNKSVQKVVGFPKFKTAQDLSYKTPVATDALERAALKVPKVGKVRILNRPFIDDQWELKSIIISKSPDKKYYAGLLYTSSIEEL